MADKNMEAQISVEFEEATSRQSLNSGETINTLWGKVRKWLSDLKAVAFSGSYNDLSDKPEIPTNFDITAIGNPVQLDGLQGGVPFSEIVVSGKNLLPLMSESVDFGGVSCTVNTDGTITLNGTSEKQGSIDIVYKIPIKSGVYTLSGCPESGSNNTFAIRAGMGTANTLYGRDYGNGLKITVDADTVLTVSVQILGVGIVFDNLIFRPQLELGSTPTAYEPPITGHELTINACGKNLIPYPYDRTSGVYNGLTVDISDDGKFSINGTATADTTIFVFAKQNNPIYLSGGVSYTLNCSQQYDIDSFNLFFKVYHADGTYSGFTVYPASFTAKNGDYLVGSLWIKSGSVVNAENVEIQLELGSTPTAYEPYHSAQYTITPDSNPYSVPNDIRQQDGLNNVSISAGKVSVTGVKKSPVINRAWEELDNKANLTDIPTTLPANGGNADTAKKLASAHTIDGISFNGTGGVIHYTTCSTAAATAAKTVSLTGFTLATGAKIAVKFTVTNTAANPTLNVNNTGAKAIYYRGAAIGAGYLAANRTYEFIYNGTQYELVGDLDTNTDTHWISKNIVGASNTATVNAAATNGKVYLNHLENSSVKSSNNIVGSGATTVTSDANGKITISSTNTDTKVTNTLNTTAKAYVTGTTSATTNTGTQVFDTGVYLDTTAGQLVATTFKGDLSGTAENAIKIETFDASGNPYTGEDKENNKVYVQWDGVKYLKLSNDYNKTAADYAASAGIVGVVNYPSSGTTGSVVLGFKPSCVIAVSQSFTNSSAGQKSFAVMITGNVAQTLYHPEGSVIISLTDTGFSANFNSGTVSMFRYIAFK